MKRILLYIVILIRAIAITAENIDDQLWQAIMSGDEQLSIELLHKGANINALDAQGLALMHRYASSGNEFMLDWLYNHGADVNVRDFEGSTPIFYAAINGDYRRAYHLIQLGADVNIVNIKGMSLLKIAEHFGSKLLIDLFKDPSTYSSDKTTTDLYLERQSAIQSGEWDKAIALAKLETKQASKEWTKTSPYYTRGTSDLGMIYIQLGRYDDAEKCINKTLSHWKKILPESEQYYFNLTALAFLQKETNQLELAAKTLNECIKNIDSFTNPQVVWQVLLNSGDVFSAIGYYDSAEKAYTQALQQIPNLPQVLRFNAWSMTYGNYAVMLFRKNTPESIKQYGKAIYDLIDAMEQQQQFDQNYLRFKQQQCVYEEVYGDLSIASDLSKELLIATKALLGEMHNDYLSALNLASEIAANQNDYMGAYEYLSNAIDIIMKRNYPVQEIEINILSNWAGLVDMLLEDNSSEWAHKFAFEATRDTYGEKSVSYIKQANEMGIYYANIREFSKGIQYQKKAYTLSKDYYGADNLNTIMAECGLWQSYAAIPSMRDSAYHYLIENDQHIRDYLQSIFGTMSEQQREQFWNNHFNSQYAVTRPSFLIDYATIYPVAYGDIYNTLLLTRGLLLNSNDGFSRIIANTRDTILQSKWEQVKSIKIQLSTSQSLQAKEHSKLEREKDRLEREIAHSSEEFRLAQENFTIRWQDIKSALTEDEVAIEFLINSINHWGQFDNKSDSVMYYALVLRKDHEYPIFIPLFERDEIIHFNYHGKYEGMYDYIQHGDSAYNLIWNKIRPYLTGVNTIYFAPTHALAQIALEAIPTSSDSVFGDYYNMVRLSSTREILKFKDVIEPNSAVLYGGVQYDVASEDMYIESARYADIAGNISRSVEPSDTTFRGRLSYLPGTKREVESINMMLNQQGREVSMLTGSAANEESFVALSGKHKTIIHLATHGFFWRQKEASEKDMFKMHDKQNTMDPLSRCGLLFAGANIAYQGHAYKLPEGVQDGILTAREISTMDLSGCELAVLSACETGVGEYSEDGTLGLQRAFKQAGVKSIIMTLWPVNDSAAQLMMTEFYKNWLSGQSKREAFRNAQNTVRSQYEEPVYWAGFIMLD